MSTALVDDLDRQVQHWLGSARGCLDAESFASRAAWTSVEHAVGLPVRTQLATTVDELIRVGRSAEASVRSARTQPGAVPVAQAAVERFRRRYLQVETTLDFFGQAVNSRTSRRLESTMATLDRLALQSIEASLGQVGIVVPPVLTYIGEGLGASIIRAGIRLWAPGTVNPVAAIKVVRHNLFRPTSLFHETGHQVAHLTGWNDALQAALGRELSDDPALRSMWQPWSSEVTADVYAFVLTGYASVAALHDVVADSRTILRWPLGDPHPVGWLRVLLGTAMCRASYGPGPWDRLEEAVLAANPLERADESTAPLLRRSHERMDRIARTCLTTAVPGFGGRPVTVVVDPQRVSPRALVELERSAGAALWTSPHWRQAEGIRIVALAGLREAEHPDRAGQWVERAEAWFTDTARAA
ncbi:hypothetical protein G7075_17630 [Phycicoccus sp. HDW14]|uniref:hypothetical protein n=1 Tax=Phycicoccus sp. HDW14 TaxID=2714941 RepID=UPI00140CE455|nr:hypothetical protein [Phycicoccus sp. HDW14]QIM22526.1 hypothetical protein G7075_17630 [Phycicoccus sp. HDW14]